MNFISAYRQIQVILVNFLLTQVLQRVMGFFTGMWILFWYYKYFFLHWNSTGFTMVSEGETRNFKRLFR